MKIICINDDDEITDEELTSNTGVQSTLPWVTTFIVSCAAIVAELLRRRKA